MAAKHIALRTCVQCRQIRPKRELVRIVRTPEGHIEIDEKGKMSGRGAYLCRNRVCWDEGIGGERLDHALKTKVGIEDRQRLRAYAESCHLLGKAESRQFRGEGEQLPVAGSEDSAAKGDRDS